MRLADGDCEILCCPEDVSPSQSCRHDHQHICSKCNVPICNECWRLSTQSRKIPKALANDNFIGYVHQFLVDHKVTWLESIIAGPVFSGLVTYYIEGPSSERHHMMEAVVGKPDHAYGVRGNLFSFLLPWEEIMAQLFKKVEAGDLSEWPLNRYEAARVVRVRLVRGPQQILDKFRELRVRSWVVRKLAHIYIERHQADLCNRPGVLKIHGCMREAPVESSLKEHVNKRVAAHDTDIEYNDPEGPVPVSKTNMKRPTYD